MQTPQLFEHIILFSFLRFLFAEDRTSLFEFLFLLSILPLSADIIYTLKQTTARFRASQNSGQYHHLCPSRAQYQSLDYRLHCVFILQLYKVYYHTIYLFIIL